MDSSTADNGIIGSCGSKQSPETPRLCARGCGFFGTAENRDLCSKCYTDSLKVKIAKSEAAILGNQSKINIVEIGIDSATTTKSDEDVIINPSVSVKNRCGLCNKKVGALGFACRCGGTFCGMHRYPEAHTCKFDFKEAGKIIIQKENPVCKADKIRDRV